eukprot:scaffold4003_cov165-Amphora_coffeaeformis.AAC.18
MENIPIVYMAVVVGTRMTTRLREQPHHCCDVVGLSRRWIAGERGTSSIQPDLFFFHWYPAQSKMQSRQKTWRHCVKIIGFSRSITPRQIGHSSAALYSTVVIDPQMIDCDILRHVVVLAAIRDANPIVGTRRMATRVVCSPFFTIQTIGKQQTILPSFHNIIDNLVTGRSIQSCLRLSMLRNTSIDSSRMVVRKTARPPTPTSFGG